MLAGGMTIAAPSMMPQAAAAGQLYVSAENAQFGNLFAGGQVIEVIVRDPNRADTEVAESEPTVRVDNQLLRMAQGVDGYWYAYFADDTALSGASGADTTANNLDYGLDLSLHQDHLGISGAGVNTWTTEAKSTFLTATNGVISNPPTLSNYNGTNNAGADPVTSNADQSTVYGQIGVNATEWPFIQTYDFTQGDFDVILEQAGADEVVTLDYNSADLDDYASLEVDRWSAPLGANVHITIIDNQLNIDPTNEDIVVFRTTGTDKVSFTNGTLPGSAGDGHAFAYLAYDNSFSDNGVLTIDYNANSAATAVLTNQATADDTSADTDMVFFEGADNSGIFSNTDDADLASLLINTAAKRGTTATISYNDVDYSLAAADHFGTIDMDESSIGAEWNSGETLDVTLIDEDLNLNSLSDEDMTLSGHPTLIPSMQIGSPITLEATSTLDGATMTVGTFNKIATISGASTDTNNRYNTLAFVADSVADYRTSVSGAEFVFLNYDVSQVISTVTAITMVDTSGDAVTAAKATTLEAGLVQLNTINAASGDIGETDGLRLNFTTSAAVHAAIGEELYVDVFTFGDRNNNAIYRMLLEETDDNTATFVGDVEFIMLNQLNVDTVATYTGLAGDTFSDSITIIVHEDLTDEDSPRVNYLDLGADGVSTQIADQVAAPSHSGVVSFDMENYKTADTVVITLDDQDLNTDSELIDVYITQDDDNVGDNAGDHVLDVTFNDVQWQSGTDAVDSNYAGTPDDGLQASGFTLVETAVDSGLFVGSFQIPSTYYDSGRSDSTTKTHTTTGTDIEVNYNDHRDASGETIEVGDGASVNANTGSVSFDRTVYPVPFGNESGATSTDNERFALHSSALNLDGGSVENALAKGDVTVHVRVTDADYDVSAMGEDKIEDGANFGVTDRVSMKIQRGSDSVTVMTFGNSTHPIVETSPTSGVFEYDHDVAFTDGPETDCPASFAAGCVLQGDIITVTYSDVKDASGQAQTVTDSATFDLRNGVLQSDKSVYLIGSDMILTLIEPDFDLDNDGAESYTLDLIEWDSDAATTSMGLKGLSGANAAFDPEPSALRETGDSTGIFQVVIEIPETLDSEQLDRGEVIELEYTDWGPAGANYVGQEDEDIGLTVYTSNFGATIELDQKVYT
jgi:hypothetical protein